MCKGRDEAVSRTIEVQARLCAIEVCLRSGAGRDVRDAVTWSAPESGVSVHVELAELFSGIV
jgi:hypothetical protein